MNTTFKFILSAVLATSLGAACSSSEDTGEPPDTYEFDSRFEEGSSVSYSGQSLRQILIADLSLHILELTERIDQGYSPAAGDVVQELDFYFRFDSTVGGQSPIALASTVEGMEMMQSVYDDISSGKNLVDKFAGNDSKTDHRDWSSEFVGWDGAVSPNALLDSWFQQIDDLAVARAAGDIALDPTGAPIEEVYITADGLDLRELSIKFLMGAVNYAQATDDYLDDDIADKGILVGNLEADDGDAHTALEHHWDEAFGYFGAARNYSDYSDDEIAGKGGRDEYAGGFQDFNADGALDFRAEYNFAHSTTAAKRDRGADSSAPTDFTAQIFGGFVAGRHLISTAGGDLDGDQLAQLQEHRDAIVSGWEQAIAATCVHYINETLEVMETADTAEYSFSEHAKVWSELKGYSLGLQFNPRMTIADSDFVRLQTLIGTAPVLPTATSDEIEAYRADLLEARTLLADSYSFAAANVEVW